MNSFTSIFLGFHLDFKNFVLSPPRFTHVSIQATQSNFEEPPLCSQHLWETFQGGHLTKPWILSDFDHPDLSCYCKELSIIMS